MKAIQTGFKETFKVETLIMLLVAVVSYMAARLLHQHLIGRINFLARIPEVSDIIIMVVGGGLVKGNNGTAAVIGAGISLVNNLGSRLGVNWLRVG